MKVEITFKEVEALIAPSMDSPVKLEYLGLNNVKVKYGRLSAKVSIRKIEDNKVTLSYELDSFKNLALRITNYFFNFHDKMNPKIFDWDIHKKTVDVDINQVDDLNQFRKHFTVSNILINSVGFFIYFKIHDHKIQAIEEANEQ